MMIFQLYAKIGERLAEFDKVLSLLSSTNDSIYLTREHKRSFVEFDKLTKTLDSSQILMIHSLHSLGFSNQEIVKRLGWFVHSSKKLVICEVPSTYEYGVSQPMNEAILRTLIHSLDEEKTVNICYPRSHSGRNKIPYPNNWEEYYEEWEREELSSKDFIAKTGLKRATFYNLVTQYRKTKDENEQYLKKYQKDIG